MSDAAQIAAGQTRWQQRYDEGDAAGRVPYADFTTLSG